MKKTVVLSLMMLFLASAVTGQSGIRFTEGSWAELLAKAKEENRLIFMDAYATWCGPCKKMAADVFPQEEVGNFYNAMFLPVKIDMEKGEGIALARLYNVRAYPTLLFINWKGEVVHKSVGGRQAEGLIELGKEALDDTRNFRSLERAYHADPDNSEKVMAYATALQKSYDKSYNEVIASFLKEKPADFLKSPLGWEIISKFIEDPSSEAFAYFVANKAAFEAIAGKPEVESKLDKTIQMMIGQALRKKNAEAMEEAKLKISAVYPEKADYYHKMANIQYQRSSNNWVAYGYAVMDLLKLYPEKDGQKMNAYGWDFYQHVDDQKLLAFITKQVGDFIKKEDSYAIHDTYAALLFKTKNYKDALKEAKAAIALAEKEKIPFEETQELIREIEAAMKKK